MTIISKTSAMRVATGSFWFLILCTVVAAPGSDLEAANVQPPERDQSAHALTTDSAQRQIILAQRPIAEPKPSGPTPSKGPNRKLVDLTEFNNLIGAFYPHGAPLDKIVELGSDAIPLLTSILRNSEKRRLWQNAVIALGAIGDQQSVPQIITFVQAGRGTLTPMDYHSKAAGLIALGYIANTSGDKRATDYLVEGTTPTTWMNRVRWESPFADTMARRNLLLAEISILGLTVSGRPEGRTVIERLRSRRLPADFAPVARSFRGSVDSLLEEHRLAQRLGVVRYEAQRKRKALSLR